MAGYGDDASFNAWMADNGYALPSGAPSAAVLRNRGSNYIDAVYGSRFSGVPTDGVNQERAWPRTGAFALGSAIPPDLVPNAVVIASYHAALGAISDLPPNNIGSPSRVKRRKVGDVETEFEASGSTFSGIGDVPVTLLDGLLGPFLAFEPSFFIRSVG